MLDFYRGVGIENCWMAEHDASVRPGKRLLDVFLQMQHYTNWEADLELAAGLGINAIRYSVPWYKANPSPGVYDWEWISQPLQWLKEHNITAVVDLLHYGTPLWMENGLLNEHFPERFAEYSAAFAKQFEGTVDHYTPCNEPQTTAGLAGALAVWPPYLHGLDGWYKLAMQMGRAMVRSSQALRQTLPNVTLISADCRWANGYEGIKNRFPELESSMGEHTELLMNYFPSSLVYGKDTCDEFMKEGLARTGLTDRELSWFEDNLQPPDIMGFNFYPFEWPKPIADINVKRNELYEFCRNTAKAFKLPLYLTETSGGYTEDEKLEWIALLERLVNEMRGEGIKLIGLNWWPLFETIQWHYRDNSKTVEECIEPGGWNNGIYVIKSEFDGKLSRVPTRAVEAFRDMLKRIPAN